MLINHRSAPPGRTKPFPFFRGKMGQEYTSVSDRISTRVELIHLAYSAVSALYGYQVPGLSPEPGCLTEYTIMG